ncbi:MAG: LysM peptidoglycan-binding domain-containing protein [Dermatophilaceae bacterium]
MSPVLLLALPAALPATDLTAALHASAATRHTVQAGETVFDLAMRYGTSVEAIAAANGLGDASLIMPGQTLTIPGSSTGGSSTGSPSSGTGGSYTVRAGDTLSGIAAATGTTVSALAAANGISTDAFIYPGQSLRLSGTASTTPKRPASTTGSYTVRSGDTLSGIAAATGSTVAAIAKASGISPYAYLQIGQVLTIPTRTDRGDSGTSSGTSSGASAWADTMPNRSAIRDLISSTAAAYGVDPHLALAIGWQESGWQQGVTSSVGAIGAMQVMPSSGQWASDLVGRTLNLYDARDNVTAGVAILRQLTALAVNRDEAIAAYYQGLSSVRQRGMYADTRQYVANVTYFMTRV